ncbi:MAG: cell envelope biogenesis protein OmpA, partial [Amphiplicatus sp.]
PFWGIPEEMYDEVALGAAANGPVNAVDPDFDIPSQWKAAIGATYNFDAPAGLGEGYTLSVDFLYTKDRTAATIVDATLEQIDTAPDGRPIYRRIDRSDPLCDTSPATCASRGFNQDFILTNNDGGSQKVISAILDKEYDFDNGWRANWALAYAYTKAEDRNPMTSSVAFSNYTFSTSDPNNPALATSNYEVPHRFTVRAGVARAFFGEYETKANLFGVVSQSRPYSFNFADGGDLFGDTIDDRHLLYVPTGSDDPNVIFAGALADPARQAEFFSMLADLGLDKYAGGIVPRNSFQSDWYSQWDLRIEQELPGLFRGHKAAAFIVIDNIGNLINDKWGVINQAGFPGAVDVVTLDESGLGPNGEYVFDDFNQVTADSIQSPITSASVWEIRFGVKYEF